MIAALTTPIKDAYGDIYPSLLTYFEREAATRVEVAPLQQAIATRDYLRKLIAAERANGKRDYFTMGLELDEAKEMYADEKKRRIYYQNMVYSICGILDVYHRRKPGAGVVCGTVDEPSNAVISEVNELAAKVSLSDTSSAYEASRTNDADPKLDELRAMLNQQAETIRKLREENDEMRVEAMKADDEAEGLRQELADLKTEPHDYDLLKATLRQTEDAVEGLLKCGEIAGSEIEKLNTQIKELVYDNDRLQTQLSNAEYNANDCHEMQLKTKRIESATQAALTNPPRNEIAWLIGWLNCELAYKDDDPGSGVVERIDVVDAWLKGGV